jgi:hypothetical protein
VDILEGSYSPSYAPNTPLKKSFDCINYNLN